MQSTSFDYGYFQRWSYEIACWFAHKHKMKWHFMVMALNITKIQCMYELVRCVFRIVCVYVFDDVHHICRAGSDVIHIALHGLLIKIGCHESDLKRKENKLYSSIWVTAETKKKYIYKRILLLVESSAKIMQYTFFLYTHPIQQQQCQYRGNKNVHVLWLSKQFQS